MNAANNFNGAGKVGRNDVYTLDKESRASRRAGSAHAQARDGAQLVPEPLLRDRQTSRIRRITLAWQHRIADVIVATERALPAKHMIAQNIANKSAKIAAPHGSVDLQLPLRHAARNGAMNYSLNK